MRFAEFKKYLSETEGAPGYYVIGDSHAVAVGGRTPWHQTAVGGRQANSSEIIAKIPQITPGSIVVVAAGANDTANSYKSANKDPKKVVAPNVIASRVVNLINSVKNQKPKKIIFLLFPNGKARTDGMSQWYNGDYQEQVRTAIKNAISVDQIIDQNDYQISADNIHLIMPEYIKIANEIVQQNPLGKLPETPGVIKSTSVGPQDRNNPMRRQQGRAAVNPNASGNPAEEGQQFFIDVPTSRRSPAVRDVQQALEKLGYSVGPTGLDGIRGKYTIGAVKAFQRDNPPLEQDGDPGPETVGKLNAIIKSNPEKFKGLVRSKPAQVRSIGGGNAEADVGDLMTDTDTDIETARTSSEKYLGRKMSDTEWTALMKVTAAEENNTEALGWVIGAILNRVKQGSWGDDVVSVVTAGGQFQPVTGTYDKVNRRWLGKGLPALAVPSGTKLRKIITAATEVLPSVPNDIINFTSNLKSAYGPGTNPGYRDDLLKRGGVVKGNSIFAR